MSIKLDQTPKGPASVPVADHWNVGQKTPLSNPQYEPRVPNHNAPNLPKREER